MERKILLCGLVIFLLLSITVNVYYTSDEFYPAKEDRLNMMPIEAQSLGAEYLTFVSNDPTEDGYIEKQSSTYTRFDTYYYCDMGYRYGSKHWRAYVEWDISDIPDNAIIDDVIFKYHGSDASHTYTITIHTMNYRPSISSDSTVFDDTNNGINLGFFDLVASANQQVDLDGEANNIIKDQLDDDWFAIGFYWPYFTTIDKCGFYSVDNPSPNPAPTLEITYSLPATPQLEIQILSEVDENEEFQVTISADGSSVEGATVSFSGSTKNSAANGVVTFSAPSVDSDTGYLISVSKSGYLSAEVSIAVLDVTLPVEPQLVISAPSSVVEESSFQITITANGLPIEGVTVSFMGITYYSMSDGIVNLMPLSADSDTNYLISISKLGYLSAEVSIAVLDVPASTEPQLAISAPSSVIEESSFQITITANDLPVENVLISFSGETYYTNNEGNAMLSTPPVEKDTEYIITASLTNYLTNTLLIVALNQEKIVSEGYIFGKVLDDLGNSIEDVKVCAILISTESTSKCVFTDSKGNYNIIVTPGSYSMEAGKEGYITSNIHGINVQEDEIVEVNFTLQEEVNEESKSFVEYAIQEEIKKGSIVGTIDVASEEEQISLYGDINVELVSSDISSDDGIRIIISGEEQPGTKIVVYLGKVDDEIAITYDGIEIEQNTNVEAIFKESNDNAEWLLVEDSILIVNIPHYSEHEILITLKETIEPLGGLVGILTYIGIFALVAFLFVGIGTIRRRL